MSTLALFKTRGNNNFLHSPKPNQFMLLHPLLKHFIELRQKGIQPEKWMQTHHDQDLVLDTHLCFPWKQVDYYYKKYQMLAAGGYFDPVDVKSMFQGKLNGETVKFTLANTRQVSFETTDACNLQCAYCAYGKFYNDYDERRNQFLDPSIAIAFLEYLFTLLDSDLYISWQSHLTIGFYGGEPLLNFPFIKKIVGFIKRHGPPHHRFQYSMTTNGMLLTKYIDFLAENEFRLLISLDGDCTCNGYRLTRTKKESFQRVERQALLIKQLYPAYFDKFVNFNSVLHNLNTPEQITEYFAKTFQKSPNITGLALDGVNPEHVQEFITLYRDMAESYNDWASCSAADMICRGPEMHRLHKLLACFSGYIYKDYNDLLDAHASRTGLPTGTCLPFGRKVFISVNGKILPCERIGHENALGHIGSNGLLLDFDVIADKYNHYYEPLVDLCVSCARNRLCTQCLFNLRSRNNRLVCPDFTTSRQIEQNMQESLSVLEMYPDLYAYLTQNVMMS
jgi:uncharacterized protein